MNRDLLGLALPAVPLLAALIGLLLRYRQRMVSATLAVGGSVAALALAIAALIRGPQSPDDGVTLARFGTFEVTIGAWLDGPAALVAVAVTVVALAVQVYSVAYLHDDERYVPYAAQVSLFTAAMLLVVVSGDLIMLLVGWEVMGICSYLLIGHDRRLPEAPRAAVKAFLVTRVGDVGFLLGIVLLGAGAGSFRIADVLGMGDGECHDNIDVQATCAGYSPATLTAACILLLAGVAGKSAQFPLHTWLPDAMAGPTPISALIHAATMVAAGVYVVARLYPLFVQAPASLAVLAVMASITMLLGGLAAMAQVDIKRVLAYSTVSQLGYMTGALAIGAPDAALLHLLTHAAFKALLFLAAGLVIHAVGSNLVGAMGGLRGRAPVAFWSMTIGLGALAGLPPLAGFWSKESIVGAAQEAALHGSDTVPGWAAWLVLIAALSTVVATAWYATRMWRLVFFGASRSTEAVHAEGSWLMRGPVLVLAIPAAGLGLIGLSAVVGERLGNDGEPVVHLGAAVLLPLGLAALGVLLAWRRDASVDPAAALPGRAVLVNAFGLDSVQDALVTRPVAALARSVRRGDESIVDGAVESTGAGAFGAGGLLARAHAASLPRAAVAVLGGAVLIGAAVLMLGVWA